MKELGYWEVNGALNGALIVAKGALTDRIPKCSSEMVVELDQELLDKINFILENDVIPKLMRGHLIDTFKAKQSPGRCER